MINIAILGFGVVGGGTVELLVKNKSTIEKRIGTELNIKYILDIRDMPDSPYADKLTKNFEQILNDPEISIVAELIGGVDDAYAYTEQLLRGGKSVVTSNKELVAAHGDKLLAIARECGSRYLFEASVGGGIPILRTLNCEFAANNVTEISGILNGTTNYILTKITTDSKSLSDALNTAKELGYAERDPSADIGGLDACRKIIILTAILTDTLLDIKDIHVEGIAEIRKEDMLTAHRAGGAVKLLGRAVRTESGELYVMVAPFYIPGSSPLSCVNDVFNGIMVRDEFAGDVMFYGRGAGALPTASAVASDIINLIGGKTELADMGIWTRNKNALTDFVNFRCPQFITVSGVNCVAVDIIFRQVEYIETSSIDELSFLTEEMTESDAVGKLERLAACGAEIRSRIRVFK